MSVIRNAMIGLLLPSALCSMLLAQNVPAPANPKYDELWNKAILYKNDSNPWLQEFKLRGRYQGQYHDVRTDEVSSEGWEDRRSRLGFEAKMLERRLELRIDFQSNDGFDEFYDGLVDASLRWKPTPEINVTVGKIQPLIAYNEWLTSVNDLQVMERTAMFHQANINRASGLAIEGNHNGYYWQAGIYSNDTPNTTGGTGRWGDGEWGEFSGGHSTSVGFGRSFADVFRVDHALLRIDWMQSDREKGDRVLGRYDDIVSLTGQWREGAWGCAAEVYFASGGDGHNEDIWSAYFLSTYDVIPGKLQHVGRLSYSKSRGDFGVVAQPRYEQETDIAAIPGIPGSAARGDEYLAAYLGAQYFINGNKLKFMAGVEWAKLMREGQPAAYEGVTMISGVRFYF